MTVNEKIKTIDANIGQNIAQYDLERQTAEISALSLRNAGKSEFLTDKGVLLDKRLLEKAATTKRFEYLALDSEFKINK